MDYGQQGKGSIQRHTDNQDVRYRPQARSLPDRDPEEQNEHACRCRRCADAQTALLGQTLMQDPPWLETQPAAQEKRAAQSVQHQSGVELSEAPEQTATVGQGTADVRNEEQGATSTSVTKA